MNIDVEYLDANGNVTNQIYPISRLAFVKHLGLAGQKYAPRPQKLLRTIGLLLHYGPFMQRTAFDQDRFSEPPVQLSDPTEKGHFSNLAGKAIADFLSKRIDKSLYTVNYEAAMRMNGLPVRGPRPDLLAFKQGDQKFAIEAKGFAGDCGDMQTHKAQSATYRFDESFSVACVSYNLYHRVQCKYYDPAGNSIEYDGNLLRGLTRRYYTGLAAFLDNKFFQYQEVSYVGEKFYRVELTFQGIEKLLIDDYPFGPYRFANVLHMYRPALLLPQKIRDYAEDGLTKETRPFEFKLDNQDANVYIDNDRVGLQIH